MTNQILRLAFIVALVPLLYAGPACGPKPDKPDMAPPADMTQALMDCVVNVVPTCNAPGCDRVSLDGCMQKGSYWECTGESNKRKMLKVSVPLGLRVADWGAPCRGSTKCSFVCQNGMSLTVTLKPYQVPMGDWQRQWPDPQIRAIASTGNDEYVAVGTEGTILHRINSVTGPRSSGTDETLRAVWAKDKNDVWAVGEGGVIVHYNGMNWARDNQGITEAQNAALFGIWGRDQEVWAVGLEGVILRRQGGMWIKSIVDQAEGQTLTAISGDAEGLWLVATDRVLRKKYTETNWKVMVNNTPALSAVVSNDTAAWIVGNKGQLYGYIKDPMTMAWSPSVDRSISSSMLHAVQIFGDQLWAVGDGKIYRLSSKMPMATPEMIPPPVEGMPYWAVAGAAPMDVHIAGEPGLYLYKRK